MTQFGPLRREWRCDSAKFIIMTNQNEFLSKAEDVADEVGLFYVFGNLVCYFASYSFLHLCRESLKTADVFCVWFAQQHLLTVTGQISLDNSSSIVFFEKRSLWAFDRSKIFRENWVHNDSNGIPYSPEAICKFVATKPPP